MYEQDPLITEFSHERFRPREAEALLVLRRVASVVKPIMRQRGWHVGVLTEFYPSETNLLGLNWNKGQKICLRLRYPGDQTQFLPFENVVDTMLHELAHIVHGPHDAAFHALWDQLRDEHEALLRKGYTGEGFLAPGRKLGGSARLPMHEARRRARAAAEQRRTLTQGSGQKLGGAPVRRGVDIRQIIADAAQRRVNVMKGCATGVEDTKRRGEIMDEVSRNGFRTTAEEDDANERAIMDAYIELIQEEERASFGSDYVPPSQADPMGSQGRRKITEEQARLELESARPPAVPTQSKPVSRPSQENRESSKPGNAASSKPQSNKPASYQPPPNPPPASAPPPSLDSWTCDICTLHNPPTFLICDACGTERSYASGPSSMPPPPAKPTARSGNSTSSSSTKPASSSTKPTASSSTKSSTLPSSTTIDRTVRKARSRETLQRLAALHEREREKPLGWLCGRCGTFMETEWWTCAGCGGVKERS